MKQEITRIDLRGVNSYLVKSESGFVLFDTGGHTFMDKQFTNRRELLVSKLEEAGCVPGNLSLVVLTHGDYDHAFNAAYIRESYGAKIAVHPADRKLVEDPDMNDIMSNFHFRTFIYKVAVKLISKKCYEVSQKVLDNYERFTPDLLIDESFKLSDYGLDAEILHIPGHTPGSIGILIRGWSSATQITHELISGDTLANMGKPGVAMNAVDFKQLAESVNKLKRYQINTVYPGHGEPFLFSKII